MMKSKGSTPRFSIRFCPAEVFPQTAGFLVIVLNKDGKSESFPHFPLTYDITWVFCCQAILYSNRGFRAVKNTGTSPMGCPCFVFSNYYLSSTSAPASSSLADRKSVV